jgi:hypothetical protein
MNHPTTGRCVTATCSAVQEEKLRHEIVESQKSLADLAKWKLIAVAAVASVSFPGKDALGGGNGAALLICLVPLICAYVDLSSIHIMLRIVLIGIYLKHRENPYEQVCVRDARPGQREPLPLRNRGALRLEHRHESADPLGRRPAVVLSRGELVVRRDGLYCGERGRARHHGLVAVDALA